MANRNAILYIRSMTGHRKPPKRLADLPIGKNYQLFWYEGPVSGLAAAGFNEPLNNLPN